jgi:hypothetical protein
LSITPRDGGDLSAQSSSENGSSEDMSSPFADHPISAAGEEKIGQGTQIAPMIGRRETKPWRKHSLTNG